MQPLDSLHVTDAASLVRTRRELCRRIFGRSVVPREMPSVSGSVLSLPGCSPVTLSIPTNHNHRLAIVHAGHQATFSMYGVGDMANDLLNAGYIVARCEMPNPGTLHDGSVPLKNFLRPVFSVITHCFATISGLCDVVMTGLSGGGWTTLMASALNWKIRKAVSVGGWMPLYMNPPGGGTGRDWEQFLPGLEPYSYLDLALLASSYGRTHHQLLHDDDSCCFSNSWLNTGPDYYIDVLQRAQQHNGVFVRTILDQTPHEYLFAGRQLVLQEFA